MSHSCIKQRWTKARVWSQFIKHLSDRIWFDYSNPDFILEISQHRQIWAKGFFLPNLQWVNKGCFALPGLTVKFEFGRTKSAWYQGHLLHCYPSHQSWGICLAHPKAQWDGIFFLDNACLFGCFELTSRLFMTLARERITGDGIMEKWDHSCILQYPFMLLFCRCCWWARSSRATWSPRFCWP